jgi:hypothetical protein
MLPWRNVGRICGSGAGCNPSAFRGNRSCPTGAETERAAGCTGAKTRERGRETRESPQHHDRDSRAASPKPLTSKQKFELSADESIAPSRLVSSALGAGIGQATDSLPGYGEGMGGYGKRFGSSMASAASDHFFETFLLASLLHRDPRYFVLLRGGAGYRIKYALSRTVVTRTDDGKSAANWPGIVGPLLAESLANSYLPAKEQTAGRTFRRYGFRVGLNTASKVLREYWPTIFRSLRISKIAPGA